MWISASEPCLISWEIIFTTYFNPFRRMLGSNGHSRLKNDPWSFSLLKHSLIKSNFFCKNQFNITIIQQTWLCEFQEVVSQSPSSLLSLSKARIEVAIPFKFNRRGEQLIAHLKCLRRALGWRIARLKWPGQNSWIFVHKKQPWYASTAACLCNPLLWC